MRAGVIAGVLVAVLATLPGRFPASGCGGREPPAALFDPRGTHRLEAPERDGWQQPARVVAALGLRPGDRVADIGAGSGYLLPHLSRAVGPRGRVFAEEIQAEFLAPLQRRAERLGNVVVIYGVPEDPKLPRAGVDGFVMLTVYHEVRNPVALLAKLREAARPAARLAIVDFDPAKRGPPWPPAGHAVRPDRVIAEAARAGWRVVERHDFLANQFFLMFER